LFSDAKTVPPISALTWRSMTGHPKGYRGAGIYVHGGGLRISGFSLSIDASTAEITSKPVVPQLRTDTFEHWLRTARR
jgi:hypothetical protein